MSHIAQDIKSGLKEIKGVGDAVRGSILQAGDEILDPKGSNHPDTAATHAKNRAIAEQGKAEARAAEHDLEARHGAASKHTTQAVDGQTGVGSTGAGVSTTTGSTPSTSTTTPGTAL